MPGNHPEPLDLLVIGGGAAGFFAAISTAELHPHARILIAEQSSSCLGKVKISGGGRCNVTNKITDPRHLASHYPRGHKSLIGPFHHWSSQHTRDWFENKGIHLKTEPDGRVFPTTDSSQTIIDCLLQTAQSLNIKVQTRTPIPAVTYHPDSHTFTALPKNQPPIHTQHLLLATGGTRKPTGAHIAQSLGHNPIPPVPSLFTFKITDPLLHDLQGISVPNATLSLDGTKLNESGPALITHWGLSGPATLRLSAWGARHFAEQNYQGKLTLNWTGLSPETIHELLTKIRTQSPKKQIPNTPLCNLPNRLWTALCRQAKIPETQTWTHLTKDQTKNLLTALTATQFTITGKSMNKDEFVTCGGIPLKEVNLKTLESKITPNLFFAGEILDIDGLTGGFNFQSAWTTAHLAATTIAPRCQ